MGTIYPNRQFFNKLGFLCSSNYPLNMEISAGQMAGHSIMVAMDWFKLSENLLISSRSLSLDMICFTSGYEIKTFIYKKKKKKINK